MHINSFFKKKLPKKHKVEEAINSFSQLQFALFIVSIFIAFVSMCTILYKINQYFIVEVPSDGGSITEGIVGLPSLVNPVLALSDADKDMTTLVFSGLMRKDTNGNFIPDIASSYTVSDDGLKYTFKLKPDVEFHDGTKVTVDDVLFTINKIKDPLIKSPKAFNYNGIEVNKIDEETIVFTLKKPYISFMDNTTVGIIPKHVWQNVQDKEFSLSKLNIEAVGSGPYKINSIKKNKDGIPEEYDLVRYKSFALGTPHIKKINIVSFANENELLDAMKSGSIDQASGLSPENESIIKKMGYNIDTSDVPRVFGIFLNPNNNKIFTDPNVVKALDMALDKNQIINQVLSGYGSVVNNPIPDTILSLSQNPTPWNEEMLIKANQILENAGWEMGSDGIRVKGSAKTKIITKKVGKKTIQQKVIVPAVLPLQRLSFSITTLDTPELKASSEIIKNQLKKIGVGVDNKKIYESGQLNTLIRARDYEALFFGQVINHESDLYSFWHSSQITDPGLNIAMYKNTNADKILEEIQKTVDQDKRITKYKELYNIFNTDTPAILIYSPKYIYARKEKINNQTLQTIAIPSDRFISVYNWYADTDHVWKIFTK